MKHNAFTLLEMSIVLVIIALIVGGIFVGQTMIRDAQLRAIGSEYDTYAKGIKEFQDKYLALPGDMSNAVNVWGAGVTANGDGNGTIGTSDTAANITDTAGQAGGIANAGEWYLAWQQLAMSGFIPGNFTGQYGASGTQSQESDLGTNVPASKLSGSGWTLLYYLNTSNNTAGLWPDNYGHLLAFGGAVANSYTTNPVLTPAEAQSLDQKLDDGMPSTGNIRAWRASISPGCIASAATPSQTSDTYNMTASGYLCSFVFLLGF